MVVVVVVVVKSYSGVGLSHQSHPPQSSAVLSAITQDMYISISG